MKEIIQTDGSIYLCGRVAELGATLEEYFERGYMIVPASSSAVQPGGLNTSFCSVYLPADFKKRLDEREEWLKDLACREAARQRLLYARRKAAA